MNMRRAGVWGFAAILLACKVAMGAALPSLEEGAQVHPAYRGKVPAKSDVVMSSRFVRDDAPEIARQFGATRVEWVRANDPAFTATLRKSLPWVGYSINGSSKLPTESGTVRDFDGEKMTALAKQSWGGRWWVTTTHPETQQFLAGEIKQYLALGANSIQVDEPVLQYFNALVEGGDFNPSTLEGFPRWLAAYPDQGKLRTLGLQGFRGDYRDYLRSRHRITDAKDYRKRFKTLPSTPLWLDYVQDTVAQHYGRVRAQLDAAGRGRIPLSMNLSNLYEPSERNRYFFLSEFADYSMAETHLKDYAQLVSQAATARSLGIGFVPSLRPLGVAENRVAIADLYAMGAQALVPWDVYTGVDAKGQAQRYFGTEAEYGDLYRFVRDQAAYFDGFEPAATVGIMVPVDRYRPKPTEELIQRLIAKRIPFAFVPVGGTRRKFSVDPERLSRFRLLAMPNEDQDYTAADLRAMERSGRPRVGARAVTAAQLDALAPFVVAPGGETLRLYPRAVPGDSTRLVVHVVDASRGKPDQQAGPNDCRRRLGITSSALDARRVINARWIGPDGAREVRAEAGERGLFVSLPSCPMWGVLALDLKAAAAR